MDRAGLRAAWAGRIGLGLRVPHVGALRQAWPAVGFFELLSENFLSEGGVVEGGPPLRTLDEVCARYPVVLHGVGLSIGAPEPLDRAHLRRLKALARRSGAAWVSDHLCWGRSRGRHLHELMPLPRTAAVERRVAERARLVQEELELPFALENVSAYVELPGDGRGELDLLAAIADRADIGVLLDVNNLYVSARNAGHGDPAPEAEQAAAAVEAVQRALAAALDPARLLQLHVAGHTVLDDGFRLDTHDHDLCPAVEALLAWTFAWAGPVPLCLERDGDLRSLAETWAQLQEAAARARAQLGPRPAPRPAQPEPQAEDGVHHVGFGEAPGLGAGGASANDLTPPQLAAQVDAVVDVQLDALLDALADAALLPLERGPDGAAVVPVERYPAALLAALAPAAPRRGRPLALRLAVYTHQVQARLVGVLREELPLTAANLGERAFGDLCLAALADHPPTSPLLRALPAALRAALDAPGPRLAAACAALPIPPDLLLALLDDDIAWADALVAAAGPALRPAEVDPAALLGGPLRLQPHLRVLRRGWRLLPARRGEGAPAPGPEDVAVLRGRAGVEALSLAPAQAELLRALAGGASLSGACAALEAGLPADARAGLAAALPAWFAAWAQAGWFVHPLPPEASP